MSEEVVDAEVVGQELATREESVSLFHTNDPVDVLEKATRVANALKRAVDQQGLIEKVQGKDHPKVEAWQTLGSMLGVTAVCVRTEPTVDRHGKHAYKATVEARFKGDVVGQADALCSTSERRWSKADDYAVLSMAQTRATSKALKGPLGWVMKLAGYESTPYEEMTFVAEEPTRGGKPANGHISEARYTQLVKAYGASSKDRNDLLEFFEVKKPTDVPPVMKKLTEAEAEGFEAWLKS